MQREFDLMLYNFSPQKLAFYSDYCQRYVDKNDYLYEDHIKKDEPNSHYDTDKRLCHIKFRVV